MRLPKLCFSQKTTDRNRKNFDRSSSLRNPHRKNSTAAARGPRSRQRRFGLQRLGQDGYSVLGGLLTLLAFFTGIGLLKNIAALEDLTGTLVDMDRCTGSFAVDIRANIKTLQASYKRFEVEREATVAACLVPPLCPEATELFTVGVEIEKGIQEAVKAKWLVEEGEWLALIQQRCNLPLFSWRSKYPKFDYPILNGNSSDLLNFAPSKFLVSKPEAVRLTIHYRDLVSQSQVRKEPPLNDWKIRWTE